MTLTQWGRKHQGSTNKRRNCPQQRRRPLLLQYVMRVHSGTKETIDLPSCTLCEHMRFPTEWHWINSTVSEKINHWHLHTHTHWLHTSITTALASSLRHETDSFLLSCWPTLLSSSVFPQNLALFKIKKENISPMEKHTVFFKLQIQTSTAQLIFLTDTFFYILLLLYTPGFPNRLSNWVNKHIEITNLNEKKLRQREIKEKCQVSEAQWANVILCAVNRQSHYNYKVQSCKFQSTQPRHVANNALLKSHST